MSAASRVVAAGCGVLAPLLALAAAAWPPPAHGFSNVAVGDPVENVQLPTLDGKKAPLLGQAQANVFVFVRPNQDHSLQVLTQMAELEKELQGRPVRFVAVVDADAPRGDVQAMLKDSGAAMPVLLDQGDALYGRLGVRLHPVVGIADARHRLAAYQHYTRINFREVVRARILRLLGDLTDEQVAKVLDPPKAVTAGPGAAARRRLKFAETLFERKSYPKALENARQAAEMDPELAAAHALVGRILAAQGECAAAVKAFDRALAIDADDATAREGKKGCGAGDGPAGGGRAR